MNNFKIRISLVASFSLFILLSPIILLANRPPSVSCKVEAEITKVLDLKREYPHLMIDLQIATNSFDLTSEEEALCQKFYGQEIKTSWYIDEEKNNTLDQIDFLVKGSIIKAQVDSFDNFLGNIELVEMSDRVNNPETKVPDKLEQFIAFLEFKLKELRVWFSRFETDPNKPI